MTGLSKARAIVLGLAIVQPAVVLAAEPRPHVAGEIIVGFDASLTKEGIDAVHLGAGAQSVRPLARGKMYLAKFDAGTELAKIRHYLGHPAVLFAEPNHIGEGGFVPDDTHWSSLWQHSNTGQFGGTPGADLESPAGWDLSRGSSSVTVAVLDTGIDSDHTDFAGRIVAGWDFVNDDADPEDDHGHGSWCSGLLAANADNSFGGVGVDHFCKIMPVKVLDSANSGSTAWLIDGLDFATQNGADVISMSLINFPNGPGGALDVALRDAKLAGAILVACAGNGGIGDADVSGPGRSNHTIAIGASTNVDARASFSGTGQQLEFVAPGLNVPTVVYNSASDNVTFFSGCSAATPAAAGIVSILRGLDPDLRTSHVRQILQAGAEDQVGPPGEDTPGWDEFFGHGRVNLSASLAFHLAPTAVPDAVAAALPEAFRVETFPNPTAAGVVVRYAVPTPRRVTVSVYDVAGRRVEVLADAAHGDGPHRVEWAGEGAAPGVYFVRVESGALVETAKITRVP